MVASPSAPSSPKARRKGPSLEALLGFVAITHSQQGDETLRHLLLQCLVLFPNEASTASDFCSTLLSVFGIDISIERIQAALDRLVAEGQIVRPTGSPNYSTSAVIRKRIENRIESAKALQERVKNHWLNQCESKFPDLNGKQAWLCLHQYLTRLFRRHGLQTVLLLDARANGSEEHSALLKSSLDDVLTDACDEQQRDLIERSIHLFLSTVGTDPDRTTFIVQLADGAFSYYSLSAPPEVAARLQSRLKELTLFLDTNFLFGLLGLHVNPFDAVSEELISVISENKLPFKLRYHEATLLEMRRTIIGITSDLKGRHWPQALSRAAVKSPYVSSIERKFHERNATESVDPETFFQPYEHPDVILKDRGILIFRQPEDRMPERSDLIGQFQEFLKGRHREKPYEAVDHDMTVLDCVRHLRSKATSSLDAKALIITCDTFLSRFDWQELRTDKQMACTVLPNQFLQLLRPFISASPQFDKSFAESFAIAEFRTISSSAEASSKLLSLLATYKDIKEETATALLANELLLEKLKKSKDDRQFKEFVDAALVAENAALLEDVIAAKQEAEREKTLREQKEREAKEDHRRLEEERNSLRRDKETAEKEITTLSSELQTTKMESAAAISRLQTEIDEASARAVKYEQRFDRLVSSGAALLAVLCAVAVAGISEYAIRVFQWKWLLSHPNSYALRSVFYLTCTSFLLGLFKPSFRKVVWWGSLGVGALLIVLISLLGGPPPK